MKPKITINCKTPVIQNGKAVNMPKDNIERAIKRASDKSQGDYKEVLFEGYAPHGIAILVETATGDTLEIRDGYVYINGIQNTLPYRAKLQFSYEVTLKPGKTFERSIIEQLKTRYDITDGIYAMGNKIIIPAR